MAWCTTPSVRAELEKCTLRQSVTWTPPEEPFGDNTIAVLDTRAFGGIGALLEARRKRFDCLVLVVCGLDEVQELEEELCTEDDIVLHDAPVPLVEFRLGRLVGGSIRRDNLTGLFQRSVLFESLQQHVEDPDRLPLSLLIFDVDQFKQLNDHYGHRAGDEALAEAALRILRQAPRNAVVARLGGDEFALLHTLSASDAVAVAERVREEFHGAPIHGTNVTVSIGCATANVPGQSLFTLADQALYAAKAKGRDGVVHYDEIVRRAREQDRDRHWRVSRTKLVLSPGEWRRSSRSAAGSSSASSRNRPIWMLAPVFSAAVIWTAACLSSSKSRPTRKRR